MSVRSTAGLQTFRRPPFAEGGSNRFDAGIGIVWKGCGIRFDLAIPILRQHESWLIFGFVPPNAWGGE
jgi:hypothetical protein